MDKVTMDKKSHTPMDGAGDALAIIAAATRMRDATAADALLFNYVLNNGRPKDRHIATLQRILNSALALGHIAWPAELKMLCYGRDVLDFGCGATLYGVGFRAIGARSYMGVDKLLDHTNTRFRSRTLKKTVKVGISLADVARVIPGVTYARGDDVTADEAVDLVVMQSVTHALQDPEIIVSHLHRALRPNGELWLRHDNFYSWGGHQSAPRNPQSFDASDPEHVRFVDWGHVLFDAPDGHPFRTAMNRIRPRELRAVLDRYFEIDQWKELPDRTSIQERLTPERRAALKGYSDAELLTRQIVVRARKRRLA